MPTRRGSTSSPSTLPNTFTGFEYDFEHNWAELTPERRREVLEETAGTTGP